MAAKGAGSAAEGAFIRSGNGFAAAIGVMVAAGTLITERPRTDPYKRLLIRLL